MAGIIVILFLSWGLLYVLDKKHLGVLGFLPLDRRLGQFFIGILVVFIIRSILAGFDTLVTSAEWAVNITTSQDKYFSAVLYHLRSAFTEELIFRGAILYLLINRIGRKWGILISAIAFGGYHIFSYGLYQSTYFVMMYVTLMTGAMGAVWAYGFWKTKSIMLPFGLHFGWNFFTSLIYRGDPYGHLFLLVTKQDELEGYWSLVVSIVSGYLPILLIFFFIRYMIPHEKRITYIEIEPDS